MRSSLVICIRHIIIGMLALTAAGCSLLSPVNTKPPTKYVLNSIPAPTARRHARAITLMVGMPETRPVYDTTQIAYSIKPYQVSYFSQNQWAETPSQMLQPLIVQTLQNTHYFHAIVTPPFAGRYDYVLNTQILQMQEDFTHIPATFKLTLRVQLNRISTNEVIGTKQIFICEPLAHKTPYCGIVAANKAVAKALQEMTAFCLERIG